MAGSNEFAPPSSKLSPKIDSKLESSKLSSSPSRRPGLGGGETVEVAKVEMNV